MSQLPDGRTSLLIIDDSIVRTMLDDQRFLSLLPCMGSAKEQLKSIKKGGTNCQRCQAEKKSITANAMAAAKSCVANARGENLKKLKALMNAKQLRVISRRTNGQTVRWTI